MDYNFYTKHYLFHKIAALCLLLLCSFNLMSQDLDLSIPPIPISDTLKNNSLALDSSIVDSLLTDSLSADTMYSPDALESKIVYIAKDSIRMDMKTKKVYLFGKAEVYYEDIELTAEEIEIDMDSNTVIARGKQDSTGKFYGEPVFTEKGTVVNSHEIKYNFETKKGIILDAVTHEGENYIHGEKIYIATNGGKKSTQKKDIELADKTASKLIKELKK